MRIELVLFLCAQDNQGAFSASAIRDDAPLQKGRTRSSLGLSGGREGDSLVYVSGRAGPYQPGLSQNPSWEQDSWQAPRPAPALGNRHLLVLRPRLGTRLQPWLSMAQAAAGWAKNLAAEGSTKARVQRQHQIFRTSLLRLLVISESS